MGQWDRDSEIAALFSDSLMFLLPERDTGMVTELNDFRNDGYGWVCRHCDRELNAASAVNGGLPRFMREGEAESKQPLLANPALARWTDKTQSVLMCPRCGITEPVNRS
jgi:hypothetical protein